MEVALCVIGALAHEDNHVAPIIDDAPPGRGIIRLAKEIACLRLWRTDCESISLVTVA